MAISSTSFQLTKSQQVSILDYAIDGWGPKEIAQEVEVDTRSINRLIRKVGEACLQFHNEVLCPVKIDIVDDKSINLKVSMAVDTNTNLIMAWRVCSKYNNFCSSNLEDTITTDSNYRIIENRNLNVWGFRSKKNYFYALVLFFMHHNFCDGDPTPAMLFNVDNQVRDAKWMLSLISMGKIKSQPKEKSLDNCPRCNTKLSILPYLSAEIRKCLCCGFEQYILLLTGSKRSKLKYIGRYAGDNIKDFKDTLCEMTILEAKNKKVNCPYCSLVMESTYVNKRLEVYKSYPSLSCHKCSMGHMIYFSIGKDKAIWW